ncbi:MAG: cytochrome c [Deltaproteobacteria bacterium]|jgi:nitric oxide reductase subunit C|nr:cytochrome c [Deltaproteobacteria bacterium]
MTKTSARNMFIVATVVVSAVFLYLTYLSHMAFPAKTHPENITAQVAHGKEVWERHACIDCHTLLGEGAYYAPELGNVITRRGEEFVRTVLETAAVQGWGTTRKMPQFDLSKQDIDDLVEFFKWMNQVDTNNWPPNKEG